MHRAAWQCTKTEIHTWEIRADPSIREMAYTTVSRSQHRQGIPLKRPGPFQSGRELLRDARVPPASRQVALASARRPQWLHVSGASKAPPGAFREVTPPAREAAKQIRRIQMAGLQMAGLRSANLGTQTRQVLHCTVLGLHCNSQSFATLSCAAKSRILHCIVF